MEHSFGDSLLQSTLYLGFNWRISRVQIILSVETPLRRQMGIDFSGILSGPQLNTVCIFNGTGALSPYGCRTWEAFVTT